MSIFIQELKHIIEGLLFVFSNGLSIVELNKILKKSDINITNKKIEVALKSLVDEYNEREGGIKVKESGKVYKFITHPQVYTYIQEFVKIKNKETLSKNMLEVLTIVVYEQPITATEINHMRGVNSRSLLNALISKNLIKTVGQKDVLGKPTLYGSTKEFLEYFGIQSLNDLPSPKEVKEINREELT